jgi:hypothetical protein
MNRILVKSPTSAAGFHHSDSRHSGILPAHPHTGAKKVWDDMAPDWVPYIVATFMMSRVWVGWI